jgi:hypothetical protein
MSEKESLVLVGIKKKLKGVVLDILNAQSTTLSPIRLNEIGEQPRRLGLIPFNKGFLVNFFRHNTNL